MLIPNRNYSDLKDSYLFYNISKRIEAYLLKNPGKKLYRMGIGDVTLPLCEAVIKELHTAVEDQAEKKTFHGYMPECGAPFLRSAVAEYYRNRGIELSEDEVFVSSGASDELGDLQDLFDKSCSAMIPEPAYPAYVDANIMAGRRIIHLESGRFDNFLPSPTELLHKLKMEGLPVPDLIYICSPNNPTGAVYDRAGLKEWVELANKYGSVILFDAAYEAFIEDDELPHSIFEIEGARTCAIEICSLSKTAGFTGTRLGYTIIPKTLERGGMNINDMWVRNRTTKTNGVSYIIQRGGAAVFTPEGQRQIKKNISLYKENARLLSETAEKLGLWHCGGKNAPYVWMECPNGMKSWDFFDLLLNEVQVIGTPGAGFGACGEGYFRFSAFASPEDTKEAAERLLKLR